MGIPLKIVSGKTTTKKCFCRSLFLEIKLCNWTRHVSQICAIRSHCLVPQTESLVAVFVSWQVRETMKRRADGDERRRA